MADLVVVAGAQGALGRAVVAEFQARSMDVVGLDRSSDGSSHSLAVNLTDRKAVHDAFAQIDRLGDVRALVNVAGGFAPGGILDVTEDDLAAQIQINVSTALWTCQAAAPRLTAHGGAIVNVGSRAGLTGRDPVAYSVSKAAVVRLTSLLAEELKDSRVRVNAVMPALIDTPANRAMMPASALEKAVPVDAIAKVIRFLCSDDGWPVNGAVIPVYGWA